MSITRQLWYHQVGIGEEETHHRRAVEKISLTSLFFVPELILHTRDRVDTDHTLDTVF